MGGLPCAKVIIDNMHGLIRVMWCMATSIFLASSRGVEPSYEEQESWLKATENVAQVAAAIEKRMSGEAGLGSERKRGQDGGAA